MNNLVKPVIVLCVICIVTAALLGATYKITEPLIAASEKATSDAAMAEVLPSATEFSELTLDVPGLLTAAKDEGGSGYAFKVEDKGFAGKYVVMVGIGLDGKITGAKLLDNTETPGLGSKTGMPEFTSQFIGKDKTLADIQTVTGATVSSKTFMRAVDTAYLAFEAAGEGAK